MKLSMFFQMKLACTALERVSLTRVKIIEHLMKKFHQDLVFCRALEDNTLTVGVHVWKPKCNNIPHYGFLQQGDGLTNIVENLLKKTDDYELAAIDALAAAAYYLVIALGIFCGKYQIEEAIEFIRLEEDFNRCTLVAVSRCHNYKKLYHSHYCNLQKKKMVGNRCLEQTGFSFHWGGDNEDQPDMLDWFRNECCSLSVERLPAWTV
ncbi:hypothetical protein REPUB_Repub04eG0024300 [Reevesia pubescens]